MSMSPPPRSDQLQHPTPRLIIYPDLTLREVGKGLRRKQLVDEWREIGLLLHPNELVNHLPVLHSHDGGHGLYLQQLVIVRMFVMVGMGITAAFRNIYYIKLLSPFVSLYLPFFRHGEVVHGRLSVIPDGTQKEEVHVPVNIWRIVSFRG